MKKIFLLLLLYQFSDAQSVSTGLSFLKLGIGARSVAMGESFTAISDDHTSLYYNPAALQFASRHELMMMHKNWIDETKTEYLGATILGKNWNYGFALHSASVNGIELRLIPGEPEGTFNAQNISLGGSIAYKFNENIAVGLTGKMLYEKIFVDEASGYGIDLGILYRYDESISFGSSVLNMGSMSKLRNRSSALPTTIRFGSAYIQSLTEQFSSLLALDILKTLRDENIHIHSGVELSYERVAFIRAGYQTGYEFKSMSAGFGLFYSLLKFDYAFVPFSGAFTSTHTFSLSFLL